MNSRRTFHKFEESRICTLEISCMVGDGESCDSDAFLCDNICGEDIGGGTYRHVCSLYSYPCVRTGKPDISLHSLPYDLNESP